MILLSVYFLPLKMRKKAFLSYLEVPAKLEIHEKKNYSGYFRDCYVLYMSLFPVYDDRCRLTVLVLIKQTLLLICSFDTKHISLPAVESYIKAHLRSGLNLALRVLHLKMGAKRIRAIILHGCLIWIEGGSTTFSSFSQNDTFLRSSQNITATYTQLCGEKFSPYVTIT